MKRGKFPFFSERKTSRENYRFSFTQTYVLALIMIGILGIYYVWILNVNATKGYNIRNLEITRKNLTFENNLLTIRIAEAESLDTLSTNPMVAAMETVDSPGYLVLKDTHLTFNK
ncbi:MAG: hypothetical protein Q8K26_03590 [Candidatus Gracilibacteria bacterium]|nr:hypothetical protein [Candidatus Gracilibacteria bacterium]